MSNHNFSIKEQYKEKLQAASKKIGFLSNALNSWDTEKGELTESDTEVISDLLTRAQQKIDDVNNKL